MKREILIKPTFKKDFEKLPSEMQELFHKYVPYLQEDIFHPYLHAKPLSGKWRHFSSFRLTRNYRCIFTYDEATVTLHLISHRKDIYR